MHRPCHDAARVRADGTGCGSWRDRDRRRHHASPHVIDNRHGAGIAHRSHPRASVAVALEDQRPERSPGLRLVEGIVGPAADAGRQPAGRCLGGIIGIRASARPSLKTCRSATVRSGPTRFRSSRERPPLQRASSFSPVAKDGAPISSQAVHGLSLRAVATSRWFANHIGRRRPRADVFEAQRLEVIDPLELGRRRRRGR